MTFSIAAFSEETGELGVVVCTGSHPAVASAVAHVREGVGAIATQAFTRTSYGTKGLELLKMGISPKNALQALLREDASAQMRQVLIVDARGRIAAHTGVGVLDTKGQVIGRGFAVAGNMLPSIEVLRSMAQAFESYPGPLAERLLKGLEAGAKAGADLSSEAPSSGLLVKRAEPYHPMRPHIDLRVDLDPRPVKRLRYIYERYRRLILDKSSDS